MKSKGTHKTPEKIYGTNEADQRLYDIFRNHGLADFPHPERRRLVEFYQLLMTHQLRDNVTRLVKFRDIAIKHFVDSVIVPKFCQLRFPLLDVGTGPGFPGIPLKIMFPKEKIILAEGVRRRVDFLKAVREDMKLTNLDIIGRNIDDTFELPVQGVITRAVEEVGHTLKNVSRCLAVGGDVFFMKGPNCDEEIARAAKTWAPYFDLVADIPYDLPNTPHQRRLVIYRKLKSLPVLD